MTSINSRTRPVASPGVGVDQGLGLAAPGSEPSLGEPLWLALADGPVMAFLHEAPAGRGRSTAVLMCPPFGWDEEKSYRGRRTWADVLARAGFPTARIDLPGTGDSAGWPGDRGRVAAWTETVSSAARWLRERTGCSRVVALGLGLGGLLAWRAAATGAPIDDLVLWGVPDSGRRLLREIKAQAGIVANQAFAEEVTGPDRDLEAVGYVLTGQTRRDLEQIELADLPLFADRVRRVLILTRAGLATDRAAAQYLEGNGVELTVADVSGWDELMVDAEKSLPPIAAIEQTLAWLEAGPTVPSPSSVSRDLSELERDQIELTIGGAPIRERTLFLPRPRGRMLAVLSEPADPPLDHGLCAVLLNSGGIRRTGPNRNWVEIARGWAARGVPTVRLDLDAVGDSDGDPSRYLLPGGPFAPERVAQGQFILEELTRLGIGRRFVMLGLCTSAYLAMLAALENEKVAGLLLINQNAIFWDEQLDQEDLTLKALESLRGRSWQKLLGGDVSLAQLRNQVRKLRPGRIMESLRRNAERRDRIDAAFDQLRRQGTETLFVFGQVEPLHDRLARDGQLAQLDRWPNISVQRLSVGNSRVPAGDHTFRVLRLQRELKACLDEALERVVAAARAPC